MMEHATNDPGRQLAAEAAEEEAAASEYAHGITREQIAADEKVTPVFGPNTIQTYSGAPYEFMDPDPAAIDLVDIAHALSNMCRFAGHTKRFYSVAEHCVLVSRILQAQGYGSLTQAMGLLHDGHEAYIWDCPRPLKPLLGDAFEDLADKADEAICIAIEVQGVHLDPADFHDEPIKLADNIALVAEANELMHHGTAHWSQPYKDIPPIPESVNLGGLLPWRFGNQYQRGTLGRIPSQAKDAFLERCKELEVGQ